MARLTRVAVLLALAFVLAGCGAKNEAVLVGSGGGRLRPGELGRLRRRASPTRARASGRRPKRLLGRFPGSENLLADVREDLADDGLTWEEDVKPALGDELDLALLSYDDADHNYVFFTKPKDEAKFTKLLESSDGRDHQVYRKIDGWTVFADNEEALNSFAAAQSSGDSLADEDAFKDAMAGLPEDAALRGYVAAEPLYSLIQRKAAADPDTQAFKTFSDSFGKLEYLSFSSSAEDDGLAFQAGYESTEGMDLGTLCGGTGRHASGRRARLPLVRRPRAVRQPGSGAPPESESPEFGRQLRQIQQALGFSLEDDLLPLFSKEGAIAVYNASESVPDVLFALRVDDEGKATELINRLAALAGLADVEVRPLSDRRRAREGLRRIPRTT